MQLHFLGANRQVTGSRYCIEAGGVRVFVDCGLFQEREFQDRNWEDCPIPPASGAALLLTHAHIDHCGLLPKFVKDGFDGPIFCTRATAALADVMLNDSAHIQEEDAADKRRRHFREGRKGKHPVKPLYTEIDVINTLPLMQGVAYGQTVEVAPGFRAVFHDAGHILGSAMLEITVEENGQTRTLLFSGDIGQWHKPLIGDPTLFDRADYVVMESTYGDRDHPDGGDIADQFARIVGDTIGRGGNVVIPTFAVERAQEIMFYLSRLVHAGTVPNLRVYLDSPMAMDVTAIFLQNRDSLDEETFQLLAQGESPLQFPGLVMTRTPDESKQINEYRQPCVIMSTSGMCISGRIKHHLRHNIRREACTILFVGFQAPGTLGRQILEKQERVRIHGHDYPVNAHVEQIFGFSGHADHQGLLKWYGHLQSPPRRLFLTHGEEKVALKLADEIRTRWSADVHVPAYGETVQLD
ncbi:MBL fold metallo-hydrolase RNA specificity domain-containing protein [Lignipirellula cremea]|uniref:Ribonuclease n=1 Tax=Lignipirellula cremea TaxID=2528010 RepID=A0A518DTD5_9BACT|nr:MBL fold metallo-hydrolase [Lignipirellula cremea]QDU95105.1 Ribonuclease [Lignipirellula cremea]